MKYSFIWRSGPAAPRPNLWTYFRREFSWDAGMESLIAFAADPTARLWINGSVVVPRVMRFVTPWITVEKLDLAEYLVPGLNTAVVLHHYWGVPTFQRSPGGAPGFAIASSFLKTDAQWQWKNAEEFLSHPHQTIGGHAHRIRFPVVMDLRRETSALPGRAGWKAARLVTSAAWQRPVLKKTARLERQELFPLAIHACGSIRKPDAKNAPFPGVDMSWSAKRAVYTRTASAIRKAGHLLSRGKETAEFARKSGYLTLDFGKPVHGYLRIEIEDAAAGTTLDFLHGELRWNLHKQESVLKKNGSFDPELIVGGPCGDRVILREGRQSVEIPEERTWRWLLISWDRAAKPVKVRSISVMTSQHPAKTLGTFSGGPPEVRAIIPLCLDHAKVTMSDTYVDTPGREDGQWLEDIQYRARLSAHWFGDIALRQVTLRHAAEQQAPNGRFRVFAPEDYSTQGVQSLDWGLTWIGLLYDDWKWTGEQERLRRYFPNLERFLAAAATQVSHEGLLLDRTSFSDIRCAARPRFDDGELESIPNAWYYGFLGQAVEIALALGKHQQALLWNERAKAVRRAFARFVTKEKGGVQVSEVWSPRQGGIGRGQGAALSAVYHGLLKLPAKRAAMEGAFLSPDGSPPRGCKRWNNPTYFYRALRCLCEYGRPKIAGNHFRERFRPYLPDGPLPEYFIPGEGQPEDPTGSHGWAAVPLLWLHDTVLGLRILEAGGRKLLWRPADVGWPRVEGISMTPLGQCQVWADWKKKIFRIAAPQGVSLKISLPPGSKITRV